MTDDVAPILITGCSAGIGWATAARLGRAGRLVFATARRLEHITKLERVGCRLLPLDVTDEDSMVAAVGVVRAEFGPVWGLVNNADCGEYGTVEEVPIERVRRQFETNVFGLARMCQLVLPHMRAAGLGRIVNVGSMGGRLTLPANGYYHASQYAVEALTDALRYEVAPFGVQVSLVAPGPVASRLEQAAALTLRAATPAGEPAGGPYRDLVTAMGDTMARSYRRRISRVSADRVAAVIEQALLAPNPRPRYLVGATARSLIAARGMLPDRLWDSTLRLSIRPD